MVVVGRGCLHGWSMWSIKPAQVTIVKPYFTLVPCKEETVSRTRFDVKLWPTLKRWNLWGSWDMFLCFCHGFSVISQENVCIQTSCIMVFRSGYWCELRKVSWCPTASLQWNSLIRSPSVFVGGYLHKKSSKVGVVTRILCDFVGAIDCTLLSLFLASLRIHVRLSKLLRCDLDNQIPRWPWNAELFHEYVPSQILWNFDCLLKWTDI